MAYASLVPPSPLDACGCSSVSTQEVSHAPSEPGIASPFGSAAGVGRHGHLWRSLESFNLSPEVRGFLLSSRSAGTLDSYDRYITRWVEFCESREIDPFLPPVAAFLDFLWASLYIEFCR